MRGCYLYFCKGCLETQRQDLPIPPYKCPCGDKFRLMIQAVPQPGDIQ